MTSTFERTCRQMLDLLDATRLETRSLLSRLDPEQVVHADERAWRVRDILGHLAVWNGEAAHSLSAYAAGSEYHCISGRAEYDDYNGPTADERRAWSMEQVWAEYEASHDQLKQIIETMPLEKWEGEMLFPWGERGTIEQLIKRMMKHETRDHCDALIKFTAA